MSVTEPPDRLLLARALAGIGLPEPTRIAPVGRPWRHANWRVGFAPDAEQADVLVRIPVHPEVGDTLSPEVAALTALEGSGLPVVRQYARLRGLGRPVLRMMGSRQEERSSWSWVPPSWWSS